MNHVTLSGNLGGDIELRTTSSGRAVCNFDIAVKNGFGDDDKPDWVTLVMWEKLADAASKYLTKGRKIAIEGRLKTESWVDKNSGQNRSKLVVNVISWEFADSKADKKDGTAAPAHAGGRGGDDIPF